MPDKKDEKLDRFVADVWAAMTRVVSGTRHASSDLVEEYDLTKPQAFTLWRLKETGPVTMGELSELLQVTHGVATRMVDRLLDKGLVERRRDEKDRRVVFVSATELGAQVTDEAIENEMLFIRNIFKDVSRRDRDEFLALLNRIGDTRTGVSDK